MNSRSDPAIIFPVILLCTGAVVGTLFFFEPVEVTMIASMVRLRSFVIVSVVLLEAWFALQAYRSRSLQREEESAVLRYAFIPFFLVLLIFLRSGGLIYRIVYVQFLICLSLKLSFAAACSIASFTFTLITLKSLYLDLPADLFVCFSFLLIVMAFAWVFDAYRDRLSAQKNAVRQARIAVAELADANIRIQDSIYYSEAAITTREKKRIAGELHDNIGHLLTSLLIYVRNRKYDSEPSAGDSRESLIEIETLIAQALKDFRKEIYALREESDAMTSWPLRWRKICLVFSDCTGVGVHLEVPEGSAGISDSTGEVITQIIKEALSNAVRHGNATAVSIRLLEDTALGLLLLKISDNGIGAYRVTPGLGIEGMKERAKQVGGELGWSTRPGMGFDLGVDLPIVGGKNS